MSRFVSVRDTCSSVKGVASRGGKGMKSVTGHRGLGQWEWHRLGRWRKQKIDKAGRGEGGGETGNVTACASTLAI